MSPLEKIQEGFFEHLGTAAALAVTALIGWLSLQIAPLVAPAIEDSLPIRVVLGILGLSLVLNIGLAVAVWRLSTKRSSLRLKYGIYWDKDKNPHCPSCKTPLASYNNYAQHGPGYWCRPCKGHFRLADASGKNVEPAHAVSEL
jgi:hypothetical protein